MEIQTKIELTKEEIDAIDTILEMLDSLQPEDKAILDRYLYVMQCVDTEDIYNALTELKED